MRRLSDEELVVLVLKGKQEAFGVLVERYQNQIFSLAYRLGGDYDQAQDMAQEAFLKIYQELAHFDVHRRFFPWMYRVAHNVCVNLLHKNTQKVGYLEDGAIEHADEREESNPVLSFERVERGQAVARALQSLPENYRLPLIFKYLQGMSYQQIAEQLQLPVSTIETRLFRGRNMLREILGEYLSAPNAKQ